MPSRQSRLNYSAMLEASLQLGMRVGTEELAQMEAQAFSSGMRVKISDFSKLSDSKFSDLQRIELGGCTFENKHAADEAINVIAAIAPAKISLASLPWLEDHHLIQLADAGINQITLQNCPQISEIAREQLAGKLEILPDAVEARRARSRPETFSEQMMFRGMVNAFTLI